MLQTFIITFFIILICITFMSLGYIFSGKMMSGTCGNTKENPCNCTIAEKLKCALQNK